MQSYLLLELHTLELIALRLVSKRKELLLLLLTAHQGRMHVCIICMYPLTYSRQLWPRCML